MRSVLHVDMDAFYASIEQRDAPPLRGRPVLVGGLHRGVVAAASYEARAFGIHAAMPMHEARRRCPAAHLVQGRLAHYRAVSAQIFAIFRRFSPHVEGLSLDEAFLDVTASQDLFGPARAIAEAIRRHIREEVGLTASAGLAPCKFVAKVASERAKPDGLVEVAAAGVEAFLAPLPVGTMFGAGPVAQARLARAGIRDLGALGRAPEALLREIWGRRGAEVARLARGIDPREVVADALAKSVGAERTLAENLFSAAPLGEVVLALSLEVALRLWRRPAGGRRVTLKVRFGDFSQLTRQCTLPEPVADADGIYAAAKALLGSVEGLDRGVRLVGVQVGALSPGLPSLGLFPDRRRARSMALEAVRAQVDARFGHGALTRATLGGGSAATATGQPGGASVARRPPGPRPVHFDLPSPPDMGAP